MQPSLRQRLFAWILKRGDVYNHALYSNYKRELFRDVAGQVVEVGPGSGVNFPYIPSGTNWIGIEPNEAFHDDLLKQANGKGVVATLIKGSASQILLPDNLADVVICTLVLCSVRDPLQAILEMKRVLKPSGRLIFIEHVGAERKTALRNIQDIFNPINRLMIDGCNCNRETWVYLEEAGFGQIQLSHFRLKGALKLHAPHICGLAIK